MGQVAAAENVVGQEGQAAWGPTCGWEALLHLGWLGHCPSVKLFCSTALGAVTVGELSKGHRECFLIFPATTALSEEGIQLRKKGSAGPPGLPSHNSR